MHKERSAIQFSPSDLTVFLESEFASWMDRWYLERGSSGANRPEGTGVFGSDCAPDEDDEQARLFAQKGVEHEKAFLAALTEAGREVVEIGPEGARDRTLAAMNGGADLIYQARLEKDGFAGWADFLAKRPGTSVLGQHHYEVLDTKLARSAKAYFIVQLCAYAEMLEHMQERRPEEVEIVLGNGQRKRFRTNSFYYYYRELKKTFLAFQGSFDAAKPMFPGLSSSYGRWSTYAERILAEADHTSTVANITRGQIKKLEALGISTTSELSKSAVDHVSGMGNHVLERLKAQARLQLASRGLERPLYEVRSPDPVNGRLGLALLPAQSPADVFFDMEGFPLVDGGLEYLFGAVYLEEEKLKFKDWWAHDALQENQAFEGFIDWIHERWLANPTMHVYHYAAYEPSAMKRLMGRYATREQEVDDLLRNEVFVDLFTIVRQGMVVGTSGYSLKDIEALYREKREGAVKTASASVVAYANWLDSGEGQDWQSSPTLKGIRDYNEVDCTSLVGLASWLREVQDKAGISPRVSENKDEVGQAKTPQVRPSAVLAEQLLAQVATGEPADPEQRRVLELLAWLLEFHWREAKPVFWKMYERAGMTEQELFDDFDCLGGLERTGTPRRSDKRSWVYEYRFDPDQDTKLDEGSTCFYAHDLLARTTIASIDRDKGLTCIKLGSSRSEPPDRLSLIPDEYVSANAIVQALQRYVERWIQGQSPSEPIEDLLRRTPPRIKGFAGGQLVDPDKDLLPQVIDLAKRLDGSLLCIQGPPGCGKTYTAAGVIVDLVREGKRIGVTSNSHKAILNLLEAVARAQQEASAPAIRIVKVGGEGSDPLIQRWGMQFCAESQGAPSAMGTGPVVVGGTAWLFSRPEMEGQLDYLFIDEAGQFSLANVVGVGMAAKNLVLVGDQMQLAQPTMGSHPGESGKSALEYFLAGKATVPPDLGILLNTTWRMHPDICNFVSEAIYEGRLRAHPDTSAHGVFFGPEPALVPKEAGIHFMPVVHEGNSQSSPEEIDAMEAIIKELLGRTVQDGPGSQPRPLAWEDILIVAPYNMQVRQLSQRLGSKARVGSVDKFQGQEAHVVIVSMCASSLEESPRGADFLLSPNRINVAVSRAKSLAIVVASPALLAARCQTIEQMELVNLFCWLKSCAEGAG